jgi:hypothetical protein
MVSSSISRQSASTYSLRQRVILFLCPPEAIPIHRRTLESAPSGSANDKPESISPVSSNSALNHHSSSLHLRDHISPPHPSIISVGGNWRWRNLAIKAALPPSKTRTLRSSSSASSENKSEKCGSADGGINRPGLAELDWLSVLSYVPNTSPNFVCSGTRSRMLTEKVAGNKIDTRLDCNTSSVSPFRSLHLQSGNRSSPKMMCHWGFLSQFLGFRVRPPLRGFVH